LLRRIVDDLAARLGARAVAVAFHDWETATVWSVRGDRWFHAASTIKLAVLVALEQAMGEGGLDPDAWLHVRNRFASRLDAEPFRVARDRDADGVVHAEVGKLMRVRVLAERMIVSSSNLATNLLIDLLGLAEARASLAALGLDGIELVRGVEDQRAHEAGIDNRVTADGLLALLRLLHEPGRLAPAAAKEMVAILERQELTGAIALGLPEAVRERAKIAHKTGEISTVAHDAGLVLFPDRRPIGVAVLSEWDPGAESRQAALGTIVAAVYRHLVEQSEEVAS
jgi:beta-lactamase class A